MPTRVPKTSSKHVRKKAERRLQVGRTVKYLHAYPFLYLRNPLNSCLGAGVTHEEIEKDSVKGKGAVLLIGWQSRQEHMDFREKETFKKNIQLLRQNAKGIEMHHTTFMTHVAG
jgi:hypothetical protein